MHHRSQIRRSSVLYGLCAIDQCGFVLLHDLLKTKPHQQFAELPFTSGGLLHGSWQVGHNCDQLSAKWKHEERHKADHEHRCEKNDDTHRNAATDTKALL